MTLFTENDNKDGSGRRPRDSGSRRPSGSDPWGSSSGSSGIGGGRSSGGGSNRGQSGGGRGSGNGGFSGGGLGGGSGPVDFQQFSKWTKQMNVRPPSGPKRKMAIVVAAVLVFFGWISTGIYTVQPDQQGIVLRFGKYVSTTGPGLHMHLPTPIERVILPRVTQVNRVNVGFRPIENLRNPLDENAIRDIPEESLILTGDENIVDVDFSVFWVVSNAPDFLFNVRSPSQFIKAISESAMREIIGTRDIQAILTQGRAQIQTDVRDLIQSVLDGYKAGVQITQVQLEKVDPPADVIDSFRDVQAARADQQRLQNEADAYANKVIPEARGEAAQLIQQAEGYKQQVVAEAKGQASRFDQIYQEYRKAPEVTRYRLYLETMESVFKGTNKVVIDDKSGQGSGVVPYLPLSELSPRRAAQADAENN